MLKKLFAISALMLISSCHPAIAYSKADAECLAQNVYFEARNESTQYRFCSFFFSYLGF